MRGARVDPSDARASLPRARDAGRRRATRVGLDVTALDAVRLETPRCRLRLPTEARGGLRGGEMGLAAARRSVAEIPQHVRRALLRSWPRTGGSAAPGARIEIPVTPGGLTRHSPPYVKGVVSIRRQRLQAGRPAEIEIVGGRAARQGRAARARRLLDPPGCGSHDARPRQEEQRRDDHYHARASADPLREEKRPPAGHGEAHGGRSDPRKEESR